METETGSRGGAGTLGVAGAQGYQATENGAEKKAFSCSSKEVKGKSLFFCVKWCDMCSS